MTTGPALRPAAAGPPSKHQLALMIWVAVFPTLTALNLALGGWLDGLGAVAKPGAVDEPALLEVFARLADGRAPR